MLCFVQMILPDSPHEEEENKAPAKAKRSKPEEDEGEEVVYHPVKLSRSDLYRPPTAEELNQLKEAESLFHCSLLKMQVKLSHLLDMNTNERKVTRKMNGVV